MAESIFDLEATLGLNTSSFKSSYEKAYSGAKSSATSAGKAIDSAFNSDAIANFTNALTRATAVLETMASLLAAIAEKQGVVFEGNVDTSAWDTYATKVNNASTAATAAASSAEKLTTTVAAGQLTMEGFESAATKAASGTNTLKTGVNTLKEKLTGFNTTVNGTSTDMKSTFVTAMSKAAVQETTTGEETERLTKRIDEAREATDTTGSKMNEFTEQSLTNLGTKVGTVKGKLSNFGTTVGSLKGQLDESKGSMNKFTTALSSGHPIIAAIILVVEELVEIFSALKNQVKEVATQFKDKLVSAFEKAAEAAKDLAEQIGESLVSALQAAAEAAKESAQEFVDNGLQALETDAIAAAAAIAGVTAAVSSLVSTAVDAYADYEQALGGIEKLYNDDSVGTMTLEQYAESLDKSESEVEKTYNKLTVATKTVTTNANNAWKTAGVSATDYMDIITTFSAALISDLDDDTEEAAEMAEDAITDMADNAATFGTDIEDIANVYKNLAKGVYTTLDNLNLGYGGNETGMQDLVEDANALLEAEGEIGDLTYESFADIIEAIGIIQDDLNISGTAAKEATKTITGSINSLSAAWDNLMTGIADSTLTDDEVWDLIDNVFEAFETVIDNVEPIVERVVSNLPSFISAFTAEIIALAPELIDSFVDLIKQVSMSILDNTSGIRDTLATIVESLMSALTDVLPVVLAALLELMNAVVSSISNEETVRKMVNAISSALVNIIDFLISQIDIIIGAMDTIITTLISKIENTNVISTIATAVVNLMSKVADFVIKQKDLTSTLITAFVEQLTTFLTTDYVLSEIIETLTDLFDSVLDSILSNITTVTSAIVTIITYLVDSLSAQNMVEKLTAGAIQIVKALVDGLLSDNVLQLLLNAASQLVLQIVKGIAENIDPLLESMKSVITEICEWISDPENATALNNIASGFGDVIVSLVEGFTDPDVLSAINTATSTLIDTLCTELLTTDNLNAIFTGALNIIEALAEGMVNNYDTIKTALEGAIQNFEGWLKESDNGETLMSAGTMIISTLCQGMADAFYMLHDLLIAAIYYLYEALDDEDVKNALSAILENILAIAFTQLGDQWIESGTLIEKGLGLLFESWGEDLSESASASYTELTAAYEDIGSSAVEGFSDGIEGNHSYWGSAIKDMTDGVIDEAEEELEINSPSKVFMRIGSSINEGLAKGISETTADSISSTASLASELIDSFEGISAAWDDNVANLEADLSTGDISAMVTPSFDGASVGTIDADTSAIAVALEDFKNSTGVNLTQNIYSQKQTAAEIFREARYQQQRLMSATAR